MTIKGTSQLTHIAYPQDLRQRDLAARPAVQSTRDKTSDFIGTGNYAYPKLKKFALRLKPSSKK